MAQGSKNGEEKRAFKMKKKMMPGIFLVLVLLSMGMLQAQAPAGEAKVAAGEAQALPRVKTYEELRHAISEAKAVSRKRVEQAVEQERVREAWEIGKLIDEHVLQHKERADYSKQVLVRLAKDLGMSRTELSYMLQFARAYPIFPSTEKLDWGDYRELLSVNNSEQRNAIAEQAAKNKWTQKELRQAIRNVKSPDKKAGPVAEKLSPSAPGKPGTYRVILAKSGPFGGELALDLGFSSYVRLAEVTESASEFKGGEILEFSEEKDEIRDSSEKNLFTYRAWVYRVLDGDTVEAVVDLGFGFATTQTLRLRGIDAPEILTADGREAKKFLESVIANPAGAKQSEGKEIAASQKALLAMTAKYPVLIKTVKSDKYDRYLADVFVGDLYVNQALVENGHAVIVEE
jgi:endonuclease YncB( thermonuclease family)